MEISTLNKVINLFMVGVFTLSLIFIFSFESLDSLHRSGQLGVITSISAPMAIFVATALLLSGSLFLGLLTDSVVSLLRNIDMFQKLFRKDSWMMRGLKCKKQIAKTEEMSTRAENASSRYFYAHEVVSRHVLVVLSEQPP